MRQQGIQGATRAKKRFTTKSDPAHVRAPDLVNRDFTASRPDALWVADFTYCSTWSGVVYVAFIIDVFSRRLVGLEGGPVHDHHPRPRRPQHGRLDQAPHQPRRTHLSHRRRIAIYVRALHRPDRRGGRCSLYRDGRRLLRQRHGRIGDSSRRSSTGTPPLSPPTAGPGGVSTTSRSPPVGGCRGSTRGGCTANSMTGRRPRSKPSTVTSLSPMRHERTKPMSLRKTQAGSQAGSGCACERLTAPERHERGTHVRLDSPLSVIR